MAPPARNQVRPPRDPASASIKEASCSPTVVEGPRVDRLSSRFRPRRLSPVAELLMTCYRVGAVNCL